MKKILLIGSNGYIGSFIRQNISKKYELTCVDTCWFDDPHSECIVKDYKDLFIRMQLEGYKFKMISKSVVWHFSARGSHFRDEAKDDFQSKSQRQINAEQINVQKFINKWGRLPEDDDATFVKPITGTNVKTRL